MVLSTLTTPVSSLPGLLLLPLLTRDPLPWGFSPYGTS
jgi:hypothetical protein